MPLTSGSRLGPYEVIAPLGAGGMGEVYRAHDTKLGRDVAVKILPVSFALDAERLARFEREARLLASLNHANIAAIYGIEDAGGVRALVLELVDGQTLAEKLSREALPLPEALAFARQICDALEAAHERGIVHRDLKPANIAITRDATVKVLDFGLAKDGAGGAGGAGQAGDDLTHSPTMMAPTVHGVLLGTAPYMSPEQARGKTVDKRTDIWAFGCVLYEMLTGRRAFPGETMSDAVAAILEREPDWSALPATTPASVRRLLARCLTKDQKRRLRDIGDARVELDESSEAVAAGAATMTPRARAPVILLLAVVAIVASGAAGWLTHTRRPVSPANVRLQRITDFIGLEGAPAISPDGKTVAFVAPVGGMRQVWVRLLAGGSPLQITTDPVDHDQPRWAPDSSSLVYYSASATPGEEGAIWEISALGGAPRRLAAALSGGDISHDGRRVAVFQVNDAKPELVIIARGGSDTNRVRGFPAGSINTMPRWSPDDRWIAFQSVVSAEFDARIHVVPVAGGEPRAIARGSDLKGVCWLPDGSGVVYSSSAGSTVLYPPIYSLRAVSLDGTGDRQLTLGDVSYVEPDTYSSGALLASRVRNHSDVWKIPAGGSPSENTRDAVPITRQTGVAQTPSVSPDDTEVVYLSDSGGHGNLWVAKTDGTSVRQLTFEQDPATSVGVPVWSPVGSEIAFILTKAGTAAQWLINRDGSGLHQLTTGVWAYWTPDGRWLYYTVERNGSNCIDKVPTAGGAPAMVRCDNAVAPAIGPDGSMYYVTPLIRGTGGWDMEIRKARPDNAAATVLARLAGSRVPGGDAFNIHTIVSPDGKWLVLPLTDGVTSNLWILPTDGGAMRPITDFGQRPVMIVRRISWSPDGRFIYAAVAETDADVVMLDGLLR